MLSASWPFLLLIVIFLAGGWIMMRAIGTGANGSYLSLMKRQTEALEAQVALQAELLDELRQQRRAPDKGPNNDA